MKIFFRVDASFKMGIGHVMRCLSLAEEFNREGADITFLSRAHDGNLLDFIAKKGIKVITFPKNNILSEASNNWLGVSQDEDADETIKAFKNEKPDWLIVDHYGIDKVWELKVSSHVYNTLVIDDLANREHHCDILLDQNWFEDKKNRYEGLVSKSSTLLLGSEFALLNSKFANYRKNFKPHTGEVKRIFIFFGGSDPHNLTGMAIEALSKSELSYLEVDVVIGGNNMHRKKIEEITSNRVNTNLFIQVDDVAAIMEKADFALGSGGSSTWERMCMGLPMLLISFAENHDILLKDLVKNKYVSYLGHVNNVNTNIIKNALLKNISQSLLVKNQSEKIYKLIDGKGCKKVVEWVIGDLSRKNWQVRKANEKDIRLYFSWVNEKDVRQNSINKDFIPYDIHKKWFYSKLKDNNYFLFLTLIEDQPIGQVRFVIEQEIARVDYSIARQFRGRGLGKKLLGESIGEFRKFSNKKIIGEVLPDNISSKKIFKSLGFRLINQNINKIYSSEI
ncbi:UDP-2,4-diacetamido-2,4,6-trideoxy-beta-L-altropyranose hydrolase [bacterium]|nr:UDP-2,4-diacetamido-2,4,6-trideoxy-beta-L-altropyranose hydrolase [bacterium]